MLSSKYITTVAFIYVSKNGLEKLSYGNDIIVKILRLLRIYD